MKTPSERAADGSAQTGNTPGHGGAPITVDPPTNVLTINPADTLDETIAVTIPKEHKFRNVKLVPSAAIVPFLTSIDPPGGQGAVTGEQNVTLAFRVKLHGIPCTSAPQVVHGTLDVLGDDRIVAKKDVDITVPASPTELVYAVKFICGEQPECGCQCAPVQPGRYATEINIHNYGPKEIRVHKRFVPVVLAGAPLGREPRVAGARAEDRIILPPHTATMDDCCRIAERLLGGEASSSTSLSIGFLEIIASGPLAVTAVYTTGGLGSSGGVSIDVEQITARRL